ncbi:MAG: hypothetical protein ACUVQT_09690, partial [bacterium]
YKEKNMRLVVFLTLNFFLISNLHTGERPDSNFKSIHQLQSEIYGKDTSTDTLRIQTSKQEKKESTKTTEGLLNSKQSMQTIINFSLMVILIIAFFLIARKIYRTKNKSEVKNV